MTTTTVRLSLSVIFSASFHQLGVCIRESPPNNVRQEARTIITMTAAHVVAVVRWLRFDWPARWLAGEKLNAEDDLRTQNSYRFASIYADERLRNR